MLGVGADTAGVGGYPGGVKLIGGGALGGGALPAHLTALEQQAAQGVGGERLVRAALAAQVLAVQRVDLGEPGGDAGDEQGVGAEKHGLGQRQDEWRRTGEGSFEQQLAGGARVAKALGLRPRAPGHAKHKRAALAIGKGHQRLGHVVEAGALPREGEARTLTARQKCLKLLSIDHRTCALRTDELC